MRDPIILLVHLIATLARLMGPGGLRSVVAESVLVKQQLLILNRSRHRAPNLCASDRILAGRVKGGAKLDHRGGGKLDH